MGLQTVPAYIGLAGYQHPVELDRNILKGLFARTGLLRYGDFAIAPTGVAQQVSVAAGRAFLLGVESLQQGGYVAWSDNTQNLVFGPPSGSARIDTLLLRVVDTQYGSDPGSPRAEFDIVAGVPSGSPVGRSDADFLAGGSFYKPGAWMRLAEVRINVGDTVIPGGQITSYAKYTIRSRGVFLARLASETYAAFPGDERFDLDTGLRRLWNGSRWEVQGNRLVTNTVPTSQGTASSTYTDLATVGPSVTVDTSDQAEVTISAALTNSGNFHSFISFAVSGASTQAAADTRATGVPIGSNADHRGITIPVTGLTPGLNTFTMKYRAGGATATFANRTIHVRSA